MIKILFVCHGRICWSWQNAYKSNVLRVSYSIYGRLHRDYLKQEHPARYNSLILTGKLWTYLADLNEQAEERLDLIIEQMKAAEGVTEELKAQNQLEWVGRMNNIRNRAEEIINSKLIYI